MTTFNLDTQSITNTSSIYEAISNGYYPNGEIIVKNTSSSLSGPSRERTLTSRTLSDALTGDALYRSPKFSGTFYNKTISSSLNSLLTGGSEAAFSTGTVYTISDPEAISSKGKLTGGAAFSRIILDSAAGKNAAIDFIEKANDSISYDNSTFKSFAQSTAPYQPGSSETTPLADDTVSIGPSGGSRFIVLDSQISAEEKGWLIERADLAKNTGSVSDPSFLTFFYFDIDDNLTNLSNTKSYFPDASMSSDVPTELIKAQKQKAMMCPAMIELIIYLSSKVKFSGGTGAFRAGNPSQQGSMLTSAESGDYISDHVFGRGFDIMALGPLDGSDYIKFDGEGSRDSNRYRKGLEFLLAALNTAPSHIVPDCVTFHEKLGPEYGVSKGNEEVNAPIKTKYPNLKYVNFGANSGHNNHIHISFSGARGGIYTGPGGQMGVETGSGNGNTTPTTPTQRPGDTGTGTVAPAPTPTSNPSNVNPPDPAAADSSTTGTPATDPTTTPAPIDQTTTTSGNEFLDYLAARQEQNPFAVTNPAPTTAPGSGIVVVGDITVPSDLSDPKFTKNYQNDLEARLTRGEIFAMLRLTVFSDEASALFAAVTQRESGGCPTSFNPIGSDWSIGFFQINLLPGANGMHTFTIPLPSQRTEYGWKLGYKDYERDGVNDKTFRSIKDQKVEQMGRHEARSLVDPDVWIPVNQAYMCYTVATGGGTFNGTKLGDTPESAGRMFNPWGEYGGGPSWGWISNVKFSDAVEMYTTTGKTKEQLTEWVIQYFKTSGKNSISAPYAEKWTQGYLYEVDYSQKDGWHNQRETPPS